MRRRVIKQRANMAIFHGGSALVGSIVGFYFSTRDFSPSGFALCLLVAILAFNDCAAGRRLLREDLSAGRPLAYGCLAYGVCLGAPFVLRWVNGTPLPPEYMASLGPLPPTFDLMGFTLFANRVFAAAGLFLLGSYGWAAYGALKIARAATPPTVPV